MNKRGGIPHRVLRRERAAAYLDMSPGSFDKLVKEGTIPAPKRLGSFKAWDVADLDAFVDHLPYYSEDSATAVPSDWDRECRAANDSPMSKKT